MLSYHLGEGNEALKTLLFSPSLIGDKLKNDRECEEMRIECLVGLEQWDKVQDRLMMMVRSTPDQWSCIQQYISCQIKMCQRKRREGVPATTREEEEGGGSDGCSSKSNERGVACEDKGAWSWNNLK